MAYKKSSFSGNGGCVHVAIDDLDGGVVWVKDEHGNECQFDFNEWRIFLAGVFNHEFDLPGARMVDRLIDVMWQSEGGVA